jgi:hypothetical protein
MVIVNEYVCPINVASSRINCFFFKGCIKGGPIFFTECTVRSVKELRSMALNMLCYGALPVCLEAQEKCLLVSRILKTIIIIQNPWVCGNCPPSEILNN